MKTLYTAFKGTHNAAFQLVSSFKAEAIFLTNSFQGLEKDISSINKHFDMAIMFGIDKSLRDCIRIETCAEYCGERLGTLFHIESLKQKCSQNGIAYSISCQPTSYLCNAAYYLMLRKIPNTVFIHIPSSKGINDELTGKLIALFDNP